MKRLVFIVFIVVAIALCFIFFNTEFFYKNSDSITRAKTVIPTSNGEISKSDKKIENYTDDVAFVSLIPLKSDETVINTLSIDFDGDGYDDQINAIKRSSSPYIILLVGLYNPFRDQYDRTTEIVTEIMQVKTFSHTCMDFTGEHKNTLMYNGYAENGDFIMKLFMAEKNDGVFSLRVIGDFKSDNIINIQQLDRYDSYESQKTDGVSFPIWVYSSDAFRGGSTLDQIQTRYVWNASQKKYVKSFEKRVAETRVVEKEVSKIQNGTSEDFMAHIDGLWYKTSSSSGIRYVFFNSRDKEIVFQMDDSQEVYTWVDWSLRQRKFNIRTVNSSVTNLPRRVTVALTGIDEIKITNQDDVRMIFNENNLWDGQYKRHTSKSILQSKNVDTLSALKILEKEREWLLPDETKIVFSNGKIVVNDISGRIVESKCGDESFIQIRGMDNTDFEKSDSYIADIEYDKNKKVIAVEFSPVKVSLAGITNLNMASIKLQPRNN